MAIVTDNLVYNLDASVLLLSGFSDGQTLLDAFIPDEVNADGWYGSGGYSLYVAASGQGSKTVIRFNTGNITFKNPRPLLDYTSLTIQIAAKRTGTSYINRWMGLFSTWFNYDVSGVSIFAITDNANTGDYSGWGTYGGITTTQASSSMPLDTPIVLSVTVTPSTSGTFYTNSTSSGEFTNSAAQGYFGIGGLGPAQGFFVGDFYQILIYNRVLETSELIQNAEELRDKWFST